MTSRDFCYWLQGLLEVGKPSTLNAEQVECIKAHLAMVFVHEIDPSHGDEKMQQALNAIHNPPKPKPPTGGGGGGGAGHNIVRC